MSSNNQNHPFGNQKASACYFPVSLGPEPCSSISQQAMPKSKITGFLPSYLHQRGKTRSWSRGLLDQSLSAPCPFRSSPGACPNSCPPCSPCSRPSSRRSSTPATTAPCPTPPRGSWPLSTGWGDSRSSLQSSGPSRYQVTESSLPWFGLDPYHCSSKVCHWEYFQLVTETNVQRRGAKTPMEHGVVLR